MRCITGRRCLKASAAMPRPMARPFSVSPTISIGCISRPRSTTWPCPTRQAELAAACRDVVRKNGLSAAYLRPVAYRGLGGFGLSAETPIDVAVAAWPMGAYLGPEVLENGIDACVSSWQRFAPNTIPAGAKAGGNYLSGQLIAREARRLGFGEGIALASSGLLSEGAGENLFLVFDGVLHTTPISAAMLNRYHARHAQDAWRVKTASTWSSAIIPREYLYLADELLHVRYRSRDHADSFGRRQADRQRQGRPSHPSYAGAVLRSVHGQDQRPLGLARAAVSRCRARCSGDAEQARSARPRRTMSATPPPSDALFAH